MTSSNSYLSAEDEAPAYWKIVGRKEGILNGRLMVRWLHAWILAGKVVLYSYCKAGCEVIVACIRFKASLNTSSKLNGEPVVSSPSDLAS